MKYNLNKLDFKLKKLLLIEKRMDLNNNYITPYQTYFQHFRQNLPFVLRHHVCRVARSLFGQNSFSSPNSSLSNISFENAGNDLNDEANSVISDTKSCVSSKSKRNKKKARPCEQIAQYVGSNEEKNFNIQYLIFLFLFIIFFIYQIL